MGGTSPAAMGALKALRILFTFPVQVMRVREGCVITMPGKWQDAQFAFVTSASALPG